MAAAWPVNMGRWARVPRRPAPPSSHSLRRGGASALFAAGSSRLLIQQLGRWASDAFHAYLWESHEDTLGLAGKMARDHSELTAPKSGAGAALGTALLGGRDPRAERRLMGGAFALVGGCGAAAARAGQARACGLGRRHRSGAAHSAPWT